jgi:predicted nucleic acid-binding protein
MDRRRQAVSFVLDASAALAWVFEPNDPTEAHEARSLLSRLELEEAIVLEWWRLEAPSALIVGHCRGIIAAAKAAEFLRRLRDLPIRTDAVSPADRKERLLSVAREHDLSAYDAAYLDLAIRTRLPLATFDRRLAAACDHAGLGRP